MDITKLVYLPVLAEAYWQASVLTDLLRWLRCRCRAQCGGQSKERLRRSCWRFWWSAVSVKTLVSRMPMPTHVNGKPVKTGSWTLQEDKLLGEWQAKLGNRQVKR